MPSLVYPLEVYQGRLMTTDDYPRIVEQNILAGLLTLQEERVMNPELGLDDPTFYSQANLADSLRVCREAIASVLAEDFPEVTYQIYGAMNDNGSLDVVIEYQCGDADPRTLELTL